MAVTIAVAVVLATATLAPTRGSTATTPIQHVVVFIQENHSFDEVLGQLCIHDHRTCNAASSGQNSEGKTIPLTEAPDKVPGVQHSQNAQLTAINNGAMNGFDQIKGCKHDACYDQYQPSQIPSMAALARGGAISDAFFSRDVVPSWGAHLDFFAQTLDGFKGDNPIPNSKGVPLGSGWGCDSNRVAQWMDPTTHSWQWEPSCVPDRNGTGAFRETPVPYVPTFADRLTEAGRSWGIYGAVNSEKTLQYGWTICPTFAECLDGPQKQKLHEATRLLGDAREGKLPNFSVVTPSEGVTGPTSQHNGNSMIVGDNWIGEAVSAIQNGPDGPSTTIFIYYDDCGCFYDHVTPPAGLGIRLPFVIVSPYARRGFTDHNVATDSSILAYVENIFGVKPLNGQDEKAYDLHNAFNYTQVPTPPFKFTPAAVPASSLHLPPPPAGEDET